MERSLVFVPPEIGPLPHGVGVVLVRKEKSKDAGADGLAVWRRMLGCGVLAVWHLAAGWPPMALEKKKGHAFGEAEGFKKFADPLRCGPELNKTHSVRQRGAR